MDKYSFWELVLIFFIARCIYEALKAIVLIGWRSYKMWREYKKFL